jgi:metallophosphoesterase (TIGR03767 family)
MSGVAGASLFVPWRFAWAKPGAHPAELTTLRQTIQKGMVIGEGSKGRYRRLIYGAGEQHLVRTDLANRKGGPRGNIGTARPTLLHFAHFTDIHIIDAQSTARVEFLDRFADPGNGCESAPFSSAFRPYETMTLQVLEAMIRQMRAIRVSPISGRPVQSVVCTGDNIDNEQFNELRWFIDTMDGGKRVSSNSGGEKYEGVQSADWSDPEYYTPEPGSQDKFKQQYGYPDFPGLLDRAMKPFGATGIGLPWFQTFGNHDGLMQGNAPRNPLFDAIAVGPAKIKALPPGVNPCDSFQTLRDNPTAFAAAPMHPVAADPDRRIVTRREYVEEMFKTTGTPNGHGFTNENKESGIAYWHSDKHPGFRFIGLDTVNPGGYSDGSIGARQFAWLEERINEVSSSFYDSSGNEVTQGADDRLVILFSHHGLRSFNPAASAPDPLEPAVNDFPRIYGPQVEAMLLRYPNVIAWVNGHSHLNTIVPRKRSTGGGGFWDIGTAAHIDWSCQSRLVEVIDNRDGTLSIFCTMVDHAADAQPGGQDEVLDLASISRELAANDFQKAAEGGKDGRGKEEDRNVELLVPAPFRIKSQGNPQAMSRRSLLLGA